MAEQWPISLQQKINSDNFSLDIGDVTIRTDMEVGPPKVRARATRGTDTYAVSIWVKKGTEYTTFINFYKTTLANGTKTFEFINPITEVNEIFRFIGTPKIGLVGSTGNTLQVTMTWEQLP